MGKEIFIGNCKISTDDNVISGEFIKIGEELFYKISNCDRMDPFFMTIVSNSDHWMFISSNGALSAGRKNPDNALFPYYTVDKIQDSPEISGSKTLLIVQKDNTSFLWEPFSDKYSGLYKIQRNIYKSVYGNKVLFEEINDDLGVAFSYQWMNSEKFGFIKKSVLINNNQSTCSIEVLDGIQNILPAGIDRLLQQAYSNLVDAYKKSELLSDSKIAMFMLSAVIVDKAEPSEALSTSVVWSEGFVNSKILLSAKQLNNFRKGESLTEETDIRATRGAYFINASISLAAGEQKTWHTIAEVNNDAGDIATLKHFVKEDKMIAKQLKEDVDAGTKNLIKIVAAADGLQLTQDKLSVNRHLSNVLFNVMRGGIFDENYVVAKKDLLQFLNSANQTVYTNNKAFLQSLDATIAYLLLHGKVAAHGDEQLVRLCYEYLPLSFSRRHGDPSRPWNLFSIEMKKEDGFKNLNYQGNWRDIFQNWEALSLSYPSFVESMICKFLNASTADGYNPYRITRDGIDWESPDPHDPWANIGYWGDHQVIYLQKFLEISKRYHPGALNSMLTKNIFAYANVPYRIKRYIDLVKNPFDTIEFDYAAEKITLERVSKKGSDAKLVWNKNGDVLQVNFTEKILATVLAKLSNFIPEAGIWLNTQRPEWNDANNALVGNGVSMVTLYYMRRLQAFCLELFKETSVKKIEVSAEIAGFFKSVHSTFLRFETLLGGNISDKERKFITDALGIAGSNYRDEIYANGFSGIRQYIDVKDLLIFFTVTINCIDHSIRKNKRADNLYHSYNLVSFKEDEISIRYLYEMLEGQVAVLSAGVLNAVEVNDTLDALKWSAMFRRDQYSYMLYPDRQLLKFSEKNIIPVELVESSKLLTKHIAVKNKHLIYIDTDGLYHFNSSFRNAADVKLALDKLQAHETIEETEREKILEVFEKVFDHQSFTGRSGTFYGFEGLGCIYWHMVSKLLLAINENYFVALHKAADEVQLGRMVKHYYDVRAGIGLNKSPELFGAFPTDAYSHTPGNGGAKQPGMTGQVKEDIISRFGELGVVVEAGKISFNPGLLRKTEFLTAPDVYEYIAANNEIQSVPVPINSIAFTFCQVPVVYHLSDKESITITQINNSESTIEGLVMDNKNSDKIFNRTGTVKMVEVYLNPRLL